MSLQVAVEVGWAAARLVVCRLSLDRVTSADCLRRIFVVTMRNII